MRRRSGYWPLSVADRHNPAEKAMEGSGLQGSVWLMACDGGPC